MIEKFREGIEQEIDYYDHRFAELVEDRHKELGNPKFMEITDLKTKATGEATTQILSIKIGSNTLKELIERYKLIEKLLKLYDEGELVKLSEDHGLPENPYTTDTVDEPITKTDEVKGSGFDTAVRHFVSAGFKKVEPL